MKFVRRAFENGSLIRTLLPVGCALAGGYAFTVVMPQARLAQILTLMVLGLWGACILQMLGLLNKAAFIAFGFSIIINPRKYFGLPSSSIRALSYGEAAYQFVSLVDLTLLVLFVLMALGQFPGAGKRNGPALPSWARTGLTGFAAVAIISCLYAPSLPRAFAQMAFDGKLVLMVLILSRVFSDRGLARQYLPLVLYGFLAACVLEFSISMLEYGNVLRGSRNVLGIPMGKGLQEQMQGSSTMFRIAGTYGHANNLGSAMAVASLLVWELQLAARPILRYTKIVWGAWLGVALVLLLSMSRGAWVAMAAAVAVYFPLTLKIQGKDWLHKFLKRYAFVSILAATVLIAVLWKPLERRLFNSNPGAMESRVGLNDASKDYIAKNPFLGGGIGNHILLTKDDPYIIEITRFAKAPMPAHNIYLYWMTELGIIGAFFYLLIPVGIFVRGVQLCLKYRKDPYAPVCLAFTNTFIIFWLSDFFSPVTRQIDCAYLYWMMMGMSAGTQRLLGKDENGLPLPDPDLHDDLVARSGT